MKQSWLCVHLVQGWCEWWVLGVFAGGGGGGGVCVLPTDVSSRYVTCCLAFGTGLHSGCRQRFPFSSCRDFLFFYQKE